MKSLIAFISLASLCRGDVSQILQLPRLVDDEVTTTTTEGPPNPYSFKYSAGRFPGHVDRIHSETGDGAGRVQGYYSFIDPKFKVRTVQYIANENGVKQSLINFDDILEQPKDSEAVQREKEKHRILYEKIAATNAQGTPAQLPKDSLSVARAKNRHLNLFHKIASEHAAIAAEREAQRLAFEATSVANEVNESGSYFN
ncbi:PREDICTED: uncharacterized protein LOC105362642 [Ceratosolen solmsi marchali]|uniref:Uncharacterized protein LOC105362642 n=1 Tax=Ceratosolen solmsi marchali TaxID=326594 RepID=A0AAJ6YI16_9HYME|nr:PREDICTED: uncharacterized protein LOC105362642 [Ceratosolen solmsi marchali]